MTDKLTMFGVADTMVAVNTIIWAIVGIALTVGGLFSGPHILIVGITGLLISFGFAEARRRLPTNPYWATALTSVIIALICAVVVIWPAKNAHRIANILPTVVLCVPLCVLLCPLTVICVRTARNNI